MNEDQEIKTDESFMLNLDWDSKQLKEATIMIQEWDVRKDLENMPEFMLAVDRAEREHLRNSIKFWKERLSNENR